MKSPKRSAPCATAWRSSNPKTPSYALASPPTENSDDHSTPSAAAFTLESAVEKVRRAEDGWNSRDPAKVALAYTVDSYWRNRAEFVEGRGAIIAFLTRQWQRELDYRLIKELWAFQENRISVRFAYEWHDDSGKWFRSYGNENWEFGEDGLMRRRHACINDAPIREADRRFHWSLDRCPDDHPGLSDLASDYSRSVEFPASRPTLASSNRSTSVYESAAVEGLSLLAVTVFFPATRDSGTIDEFKIDQ